MNVPRVAIVLPARYHSSRFPGKPLAVLAGKPLIEWVYHRAGEVRGVDRITVATDSEQIADVVRGIDGDVMMTSGEHRTGTDRVAEVARELNEDIIVNLQGDEPVFPPSLIEEMISVLADDDRGDVDIVTACHAIEDEADIHNPNVVKVVMDGSGRALYFSRAAIPHVSRAHNEAAWPNVFFRHIGIYVFRRESLLRFAGAERTSLEQTESLEQLRALENGMRIHMVKTDYATLGVDVPEDIKSVEKALSTA